MSLGEQICKLRKKQNLTQEQLAQMIGVARQTISKWELDETAPDVKQATALSRVFDVGIEQLIGNEPQTSDGDIENKKRPARRKMLLAIFSAIICLSIIITGACNIAARSQILYPENTGNDVAVTKKGNIVIDMQGSENIVLNDKNKPLVACKLPEGFLPDGNKPGLYVDKNGNFIRFDSCLEQNISNPISQTEYDDYYISRGYTSYLDAARYAMCVDLQRINVFSSRECIYCCGGARIIRSQICAGRDADYYEIDGGLTSDGDKMAIYGFALCFDDITWQIMLKDCDGVYYYITVKDPGGIGASADALREMLCTLSSPR